MAQPVAAPRITPPASGTIRRSGSESIMRTVPVVTVRDVRRPPSRDQERAMPPERPREVDGNARDLSTAPPAAARCR